MTAGTRDELRRILDELLNPAAFNDVAENGLQVEGRDDVGPIVCGVSSSLALIDAAIAKGAGAIVVHHGLVWGGGIRKLDGWLGERVRRLMKHGVSLFAYHLPLDAHPEVGNNAGLARALGIHETQPFGKYKGQLIGLRGTVTPPLPVASLHSLVESRVGKPLAFFAGARPVRTVGVCTGGAPELLHDAIAAGLDAYITGEVTEWVKAVAEESGTTFVAAGHHATERFGPRQLAEKLRSLGMDATFVDVENPA
jgi:dinuclear metal center YbgI/SA1388 family protein